MHSRFRILAAYFFAVPLALILGFLAASPNQITFMLMGLLMFFLTLPLIIKWHHAMLIIFWNSAFNAYFLPGQPNVWLVLAAMSFGLSLLNRVMGQKPFLPVPEMTRPLVLLAAVVLVTAWYRGGIGLKALGGATHGGKYYVLILGAIVGYFALTAGQIPALKAARMTSLYFLSGTTFVLSNLAYTLGASFYFIFYLVPSGYAADQVASDYGLSVIDRIQGLSQTSVALLCFLLGYYGIRGLFSPTKPWRLLFLLIAFGSSFFAGFRSITALLFLIFVFQFWLEGLFRTRIFPAAIALAVGGFVFVCSYASHLPLSVQRAVSFLPVNIDASVRADAVSSTDWRVQMWSIVWKEVPKYLFIGKGYSFDPAEMELTTQAIHMGILSSIEEPLLAGDYHSGPLSVLVPFGLPGVAAFLWVLIAGLRVLYLNYRNGDGKLHKVNTTLLAFYLAQTIAFLFVFGAFNSQLFVLLGAIGLSVSLNGGVKRPSGLLPARVRRSLAQAYAIELT